MNFITQTPSVFPSRRLLGPSGENESTFHGPIDQEREIRHYRSMLFSMRLFFAVGLIVLGASLGYRLAEYEPDVPRGTSRQAILGAEPTNGPISGAVRNTLSIKNPLERAAALAGLLSVVPYSAYEEVENAFDAFFIENYELENVLFVEWWAQFDPRSAYEWTRAAYKGKHPRVVMAAVEAWARQDPQEALGVALTLPRVGQLLDAGQLAVIAGWDDSGEPGLRAYIARMPQGTMRQAAMDTSLRRRLLRDGPDAALAFVEAVPDNSPADFKRRLRRRFVNQMAKMDPHIAKNIARQWAAEEGADAALLRILAVNWPKTGDPQEVMEWLESLDAGVSYGASDEGVREGYRAWLNADQDAAHAWALDQPQSRRLEPAKSLYAFSIAKESPEQALAIAALVEDDQSREGVTLKILRVWYIVDPVAADSWMAENGISVEQQARLKKLTGGRQKMLPPAAP